MAESLIEDLREPVAESSKHIDQAGRKATEDFVDHAEHTVKSYPKSSVGGAILVTIAVVFL